MVAEAAASRDVAVGTAEVLCEAAERAKEILQTATAALLEMDFAALLASKQLAGAKVDGMAAHAPGVQVETRAQAKGAEASARKEAEALVASHVETVAAMVSSGVVNPSYPPTKLYTARCLAPLVAIIRVALTFCICRNCRRPPLRQQRR